MDCTVSRHWFEKLYLGMDPREIIMCTLNRENNTNFLMLPLKVESKVRSVNQKILLLHSCPRLMFFLMLNVSIIIKYAMVERQNYWIKLSNPSEIFYRNVALNDLLLKSFQTWHRQTTFYCVVKMQNCDIISMQTTRKFLVMIFRYKIKDENSICFWNFIWTVVFEPEMSITL